MNLQQLYYFRTLAEVKHFTKAAMKLMVTQPSLSHSISDLEAELGIALFVRTNRMVTLTKYGELFLEYVDQSLNLLDEGRARLEDFISPEQGVVSLHYVSSIDPFVPYLVARYFQENKGLQDHLPVPADQQRGHPERPAQRGGQPGAWHGLGAGVRPGVVQAGGP